MTETPGEKAQRLDPMSDLSKAIIEAEKHHVENMTKTAGTYIFGVHLALKDGMLSAIEAAGFEDRMRPIVKNARHLSAQHLYDIRDEMQEAVEKAAAIREAQKGVGEKSPTSGPTLN